MRPYLRVEAHAYSLAVYFKAEASWWTACRSRTTTAVCVRKDGREYYGSRGVNSSQLEPDALLEFVLEITSGCPLFITPAHARNNRSRARSSIPAAHSDRGDARVFLLVALLGQLGQLGQLGPDGLAQANYQPHVKGTLLVRHKLRKVSYQDLSSVAVARVETCEEHYDGSWFLRK
jgi:hypothetical protein